MADCRHPRLTPDSTTYALMDPNNPGAWIYTVHVRVFCPDCAARFRFLGDMPLAPASAKEAMMGRMGAFVSGDGGELGCVIAPIGLSEGLENMTAAGRA